MANKKINELDSRASLSLSDLLAVGDPTTGYLYKITITDLKTLTGAGVISFNGRVGSVTPAEGDYSLNQLSDVIITSATNGDIVKYNGSNWVNVPMYTGTIAQYVDGTGAYQTFPTLLSSDRLVTEVRNTTGATVTKGTVIYLSGSSGTLPTIAKAQANSEATSSSTYGVVQNDIANNANGYVVVIGNLTGIDTSAFNAGDVLWLSPTVAGGVTTTKPSAPNNSVYIGIVTRSNNSAGTIEVKIQNGYELDELHNVAISSVANNEVLVYESSSTLWKNKSIATILGYTPISLSSLSASAPLSYNSSTGAFTISQASGSTDGYLSSTDWNTFNSKQNALTNPVTGTGTSGHVTYFTGSTSVAGSANHFWDATNNRLGIGLTNPQRSLEIYSATADSHLRLSGSAPSVSMGEAITGSVYQAKFGLATANNQYITGSVPGDFVIISQTASTIWFNNGAERMRVSGSGHVGLGVVPNTWFSGYVALEMGSGALVFPANSTNTQLWSNLFVNAAGNTIYKSNGVGGLLSLGGGGNAAIIYSAPSGTAGATATLTALFTIANTGAATFSSSVTAASDYINGTIADNGTGRFRGSFASVNTSSSLAKVQFGGGEGSQFRAYMEVRQVWNGSGTDQDVAFTTFKGGVGSAEAMIIKGNGNVGIGTTSPTNLLTLVSAASNKGIDFVSYASLSTVVGSINFEQTNDILTIMQKTAYSGGALVLGTNSTERMRITSGGNVGIGTSSPDSALRVLSGGGTPTNQFRINYNGTNDNYIDAANHYFRSGDGSTPRLYILSSGNVGIGTTSPSDKLTVSGNVNIGNNYTASYPLDVNSTSDTFIRIRKQALGGNTGIYFETANNFSGTSQAYIQANGTGTNGTSYLTFGTAGASGDTTATERMRITSGGNVLIGTTSDNGIKFQVSGDSYVSGYVYFKNQASTNNFAIYGSTNILIYNSAVGNIASINASTGVYTALSDINKKKDFEQSTLGLNSILNLKPTLYRMLDEDENTNKHLGFIAQEVKEYIPQAYVENVNDNDTFIGLNEMPIIAALVKAIQEQQAQIEQLKNK